MKDLAPISECLHLSIFCFYFPSLQYSFHDLEFLHILRPSCPSIVGRRCLDSLEKASSSHLSFHHSRTLGLFRVYPRSVDFIGTPPPSHDGRTRLWYAFFLPTAGLIIYSRWRYPWILAFSTLLAGVFTTINLVNPEIHNKTLMPALQSPWFAPHVIVYMFAYAMLGAAALMAAYLLWFKKSGIHDHELDICDNLVHVGWAFMTIGILFGALWAKEAWGHYWAWDPKETWAAATWFAYLGYIHLRLRTDRYRRAALWGLIISFVLLQMCWWGINYLPSAQGTSVHTYNMG